MAKQAMPTIRNEELGDNKLHWLEAGTLSATEAALAVDERTDTYIESILATKRVIYQRRTTMPWAEMRVRMVGTDGQTAVMHMYAMSGYGDYWDYMGQIAFDQGLQDCGLLHFGDTPTPGSENTFYEAVEWDAADGIGRYAWKTKGYSRFLWIVSTLVVTSLVIDVREMHSDYVAIAGK